VEWHRKINTMNILRAYNISIAVLLIVIYLALPATLFAHSSSMEDEATEQPSSAFNTSLRPVIPVPAPVNSIPTAAIRPPATASAMLRSVRVFSLFIHR
jgi:hypothetical protein